MSSRKPKRASRSVAKVKYSVLEDNDDVQTVSANYEISDAALAKLSV